MPTELELQSASNLMYFWRSHAFHSHFLENDQTTQLPPRFDTSFSLQQYLFVQASRRCFILHHHPSPPQGCPDIRNVPRQMLGHWYVSKHPENHGPVWWPVPCFVVSMYDELNQLQIWPNHIFWNYSIFYDRTWSTHLPYTLKKWWIMIYW